MCTYNVDPYTKAHGNVAIHLDAAAANRILLALERLDQESGLEPALAELRQNIKIALVSKSSGDVAGAPSTE